jgi:hypothetical protein
MSDLGASVGVEQLAEGLPISNARVAVAQPPRWFAASCRDSSVRLGAAGGAAAVEFEPVAFYFEAGGLREVSGEVGDGALIEVFDAAAVRADEVVVVPALGEAVVEAAVLEEDAADDAEVCEEADGAEDGGAAGAPAAVEQVVYGEMVALREDGGDHGAAGGRDAVPLRLESKSNGFEFRH